MLKKSGMVEFNIAILLVVMMILAAGSFSGASLYTSYETKMAIEECDVIDRAINVYAKAHKGVVADSATWDDEKNRIEYHQMRLYPEDMDELKSMQSAGMFTQDIDLSKYTYTAEDDRTEYILEVTLPNEAIYRSRGSKK